MNDAQDGLSNLCPKLEPILNNSMQKWLPFCSLHQVRCFFTAEGDFPNVMGMIANQARAQGQAIPTALLLEFEDFTLMLFEPDPEQPVPPPEWWWIIHLHICTSHWG